MRIVETVQQCCNLRHRGVERRGLLNPLPGLSCLGVPIQIVKFGIVVMHAHADRDLFQHVQGPVPRDGVEFLCLELTPTTKAKLIAKAAFFMLVSDPSPSWASVRTGPSVAVFEATALWPKSRFFQQIRRITPIIHVNY